MRLFKKEKKVVVSNDAIAEKIARKIVDRQRQLANFLNAKANALSPKTVSFILLAFCIVFASYCSYLLFNAFN